MSSNPVQPKDMDPAESIRGSFIHAQQAADDLSKSNTPESISRLQSAFNEFSILLTYKIGDVVVEGGVRYSNKIAVISPGVFNPAEWEPFASPTTPLEAETVAVLGMANNQVVMAASTPTILLDDNVVSGDASKIEDVGSGILKLSNSKFILSLNVAAVAGDDTSSNMDIVWESSTTIGGTYNLINPPNGRFGVIHTGNDLEESTQSEAIALVNAIGTEIFVKVVVQPSATFTIQKLETSGTIVSFGTSAVANTPLTTKGDILTHNGVDEQRLPVSPIDGQVVIADSGEAFGLKYVNAPVEVGRVVVTGAAVDSVVLTLTRKTKFLRINFFAINDTGDLELNMSFNGDNVDLNGNYTEHESEIFAGPATSTIMDALVLGKSNVATDDYSGEITIDVNLATKPKLGSMRITAPNGLNTADEPYVRLASLLWINTAEQIETIEFTDVGTMGDGIGVGSEFIAMGWD